MTTLVAKMFITTCDLTGACGGPEWCFLLDENEDVAYDPNPGYTIHNADLSQFIEINPDEYCLKPFEPPAWVNLFEYPQEPVSRLEYKCLPVDESEECVFPEGEIYTYLVDEETGKVYEWGEGMVIEGDRLDLFFHHI